MIFSSKADLILRRLRFFALMGIAGSVFIVVYLALNGNADQIYTDIINEYTAFFSSNKSAERSLIYILAIAGSFAYTFYYFWSQKRYKGLEISEGKKFNGGSVAGYKTLMLLVIMITGVYYFVYQGTAPILIASIFCLLIVGMMNQSQTVPVIAFLWLAHYAFFAAYRIYVFLGGRKPIGMVTVSFWAVALTIALFFYKRDERVFYRGILLCQVLMPFLLLLYIASNYKEGDSITSLHTPYKVWAVILILITFFVAEGICRLRKNWDHCESFGKCISFGTCVSIIAFNRFSGTGAILSNDMHHPFEDIIAYSQIVELGQKPFSDYIPVSGLYSFIQGAFFRFFGHGSMEYYNVSKNIMYLFIILIIVALLMAQLKHEYVLLISFLFSVIDYNRVAFIVPIALLLSLPALIRRKNLWLQAWFLTSFLHGLYYPVNGAAVCLAFLPLGIWQVVTFFKTGELKKEMRNWRFWISWAICILPAIAGIPLLAGTLRHMLAMAGQTVYADGTSRFGQVLPSNFFPYVNSMFVRLALYYIFTFLILASIVWVSVALCLRIGNFRIENRKIKADSPMPAFLALGIGIMMLVSFSYSIIRLQVGELYNRSQGAAYAAFVMIILLVSEYIKDDQKYIKYVATGFAVFIISAVSGEGFKGNEANLAAYYTVPENCTFLENDVTGRMGDCYIDDRTYQRIKDYHKVAKTFDMKKSYLGMFYGFGYYYLYGMKGASVIETGTIKGYEATQETVDLLRNNSDIGAVCFNVLTYNNYYLYHYLLTSGDYVWNPQTYCFEKVMQKDSMRQVLEKNRAADDVQGNFYSIGRTASSWGSSMQSLADIFAESKTIYSTSLSRNAGDVLFKSPLYGDDADFLYIEFEDMDQNYQYILYDYNNDAVQEEDSLANLLMKKDYNRDMTVTISWTEEGGQAVTMECSMGKGKLLIPLGAGKEWLLHDHDKIEISVLQDGHSISMPEISEIRLLKLREVG